MVDPLKPDAGLLVKIGSALVHADEYMGNDPHPFDRDAFYAILESPDVQEWLTAMHGKALLPVKRS